MKAKEREMFFFLWGVEESGSDAWLCSSFDKGEEICILEKQRYGHHTSPICKHTNIYLWEGHSGNPPIHTPTQLVS